MQEIEELDPHDVSWIDGEEEEEPHVLIKTISANPKRSTGAQKDYSEFDEGLQVCFWH